MAQLKARIVLDHRDATKFGYELVDPVGNVHAINPEPLTTFARAQGAAARLLSCSLTPMSQDDIKMKVGVIVEAAKAETKAAEKPVEKKAPKKTTTKKVVTKPSIKKKVVTKKTVKKKAAKK